MPTQSAQLCAAGHVAALREQGEVARGYAMPQFGAVKVDAVLSEVSEADEAATGGIYRRGDFRAVVAKGAFTAAPRKGDECQARGERWKVRDPVSERTATYQFSFGRFLR